VSGEKNCPAKECDERIPIRKFMCPKHWRLVPGHLKRRIGELMTGESSGSGDPAREMANVEARAVYVVAVKDSSRGRTRA
jgi:hypothetical protein